MLIVSFQPLPFYFKLSFLACFLDYGLSRVTAMKQSERLGGEMGEVQIVDQAVIFAPALSFSYKKG